MDWMKIGSALLLVMFIVMLWPRAKEMLTNSPKAEKGQWQAAILPVLGVIAFVIFLMMTI
ncbi:MAG: hypothetical protein RPU52_13315 [Candidatus Sedimenticola sp. (ex Thyasira tokunagai)]